MIKRIIMLTAEQKNAIWKRLAALFPPVVAPVAVMIMLPPALLNQMETYCQNKGLTHADFIKQALKTK